MIRRRFHRISYPENKTFYSFNPERIETIHMQPGNSSENSDFKIVVVMGSGTEHIIHRQSWDDALATFCNLSGAPPPTSGFDDISKSYFPGG